MDQQNNQYLLEIEKLVSSQIASTYWAPTMDILALITFDNMLEGYRISFKAQKFFRIQEQQNILSLCFTPDSLFIAYSLLDGTIKIIRSQNGERVITVQSLNTSYNVNTSTITEIQNINFVPFTTVNPEQFMPFTKNSIENRLILNISPHKNCNKNAIIKINYFNQLKQNFTCLLLSERSRVWILLNGFVPIAYLDYGKLVKPVYTNTTSNQTQSSMMGEGNPIRVLYSHLDDKLYSIIAEEVDSTYHLALVTFQAQPLFQIKNDIVKYSCLISNITQILNFIDTTYVALQTCMRDIIRQYISKINLIDDSSLPDINPRQELLQYLSIGLTSSTLTNFFTKQIYDTKVLQKLDQTLTSLFNNLHDIIIQSVQNGLQKATLLLLKLISYSQVHKYEQFGIKTSQFKQIQQKIIRLYTLGEMLLVESTQTKFNIRNLLIWLNKASIKTAQQNQTQIQNAKSYLNKYTVDYTRLHKFLSQEDNFKLQNLLRFFRKTEDKDPMVLQQPDFSLLTAQKQNTNYYGKNKKPTQEQIDLFNYLQKQLELTDIQLHPNTPIQSQYLFYSFKAQMKSLLTQWKLLSCRPCEHIGHKLSIRQNRSQIGKVTLTQLFPFQPKFVPCQKDQCLYLYYIDREQQQYDRIIKYNCTSQTRNYLYTDKYSILSLTVAQDIICIFQQKMTEKKIIAQVANEKFDGGQIQFGRMISNCDQTQLSVNASMRGLNCLVIGKSKLVVFD